MTDKYILDEQGNPKEEKNLIRWSKWIETGDRIVRRTTINDSEISTVFLGINYRFIGEGGPILYETMVFGGKLDGKMQRYATKDEALKGHQKIVDYASKQS